MNGSILVDMAEEIRSWGYPEGQPLILKSDNEASMLVVRDALSRYLGGEVTPENPPVGESSSNGAVEEAGKTVRELMKVYRCQLEDHVGPLEDSAIILQWLARWTAMSYNRFQQGRDGRTPFQRQTG